MASQPETPEIGWQCADCGWHTTRGSDITWPIGGNMVDLVCPNCFSEGNFIDWPPSAPEVNR